MAWMMENQREIAGSISFQMIGVEERYLNWLSSSICGFMCKHTSEKTGRSLVKKGQIWVS